MKLEVFDVVLIKKEVGEHAAAEDDFKRVRVEAESSLAAQSHADVEKALPEAPGWRVMFVAPPGVTTEPEMQARQRAHTSSWRPDREKVKFV